jgi:RNA polymerase sigma-70 factor (ECF subfamily)
MTQCASGDTEAFGRVYDATIGRLHRLALAATGDPAKAETLIRRTYLEAWETVARFDPQRSSAAVWLALILRRHTAALTQPN